MTRTFGLLAAAGAAVLLLSGGPPGMAQTQEQWENGLRPIPKLLQQGHSGLPTFGPAARQPSAAVHASDEIPAATTAPSDRPDRKVHSVHASSAGLPGCRVAPDTGGLPQVSTNNISFEFGSAILTPEAKEVLRNLGKALNGQLRDQKSFEIDGYTDAVGGYQYNAQLSQSRAAAAKDFLVHEMGVAPERLKVVGKSYCDPVDPSHPDSAANRRVVVLNQAG
jgi:OmpA-OmpF porin, OOP family